MKPKRYRREVASQLTREFRQGGTKPDLSPYLEKLDEPEIDDELLDVDVELVRSLVDHAVDEVLPHFDEDPRSELDSWLAPRLHYAVRLPRRIASDRGFWAWMNIDVGRRYVHERWGRLKQSADETVSTWHFTGKNKLRNALSRLWWGAEIARNGPSYEYSEAAFHSVATAKWALELRYSWYRPATIAFVRVCEGLDGREPLDDDSMGKLSTGINAYLSSVALEGKATDEENGRFDSDWRRRKPTREEVLNGGHGDLQGPADGYASKAAIEKLETWYREILTERRQTMTSSIDVAPSELEKELDPIIKRVLDEGKTGYQWEEGDEVVLDHLALPDGVRFKTASGSGRAANTLIENPTPYDLHFVVVLEPGYSAEKMVEKAREQAEKREYLRHVAIAAKRDNTWRVVKVISRETASDDVGEQLKEVFPAADFEVVAPVSESI